jgi:4-amino-4-deoxy-L-arabinose transferase-like glycosyltransferase
VLGLTLLWWMLARLVSRRLAWLALLVVGSSPMFCLVARQAMPDMPLAASVIGALSLFVLGLEDGDRPCPRGARVAVLGLAGGAVVVQAAYYAYYFVASPDLVVRAPVSPALWLPAIMLAALASLSSRTWLLGRLPGVRTAGTPWNRLLGLAPIATMRQVYLLGGYALLGVSVLAKGPPGLAIVLGVAGLYIALRGRWRAVYEGELEIKRGLLLAAAICLPWHIAMFLKDGLVFINQYLLEHIVQRGAVGVDNSPGTFEMYTSQLGIGMWLWAALLPAALAAALVRTPSTTREGRVRFVFALWAMVAFALFALVPTKFHHYILPAIAPLGVLVAFLLDDLIARRDRLHPLWAAIGVAIALLVCRDLMHEPERWIEMFVFRYDRAWPKGEPWLIDPSDGFLVLGLAAALAIAVAATRWRRLAACALGATGLAICLWSLHVYMPIAGRHWGMRDAVRAYYDQRTIYGQKLVYFGAGQLYDDWHAAGDRWSFDTHVPEALQIGQPMTLQIQVHSTSGSALGSAAKEPVPPPLALLATVSAVGDHTVELTLSPGERARLDPLLAGARTGPRGQAAIRVVDADRIVSWNLYWRGENFWTTEEIWGPLPELKATFLATTNTAFLAYLNDPARTPPGRRVFVITESWRAQSLRSVLPSQRARDTFDVVDSTSNKFSLTVFTP